MKTWRMITMGKAHVCLATMLVLLSAFSSARSSNLLVNGGFEAGNVGFETEYIYQYDLFPATVYYIGSNPHDHHYEFIDLAAQEGSLMMIVNGADQPGVLLWREAGIPVSPGTTYYLSAWIAYISTGPGEEAVLQLSINGATLGTVTATYGESWHEFAATWDSGSDTWADVTVVDLNTAYGGNDFAMDNLVLDDVPPTATQETTWSQLKSLFP